MAVHAQSLQSGFCVKCQCERQTSRLLTLQKPIVIGGEQGRARRGGDQVETQHGREGQKQKGEGTLLNDFMSTTVKTICQVLVPTTQYLNRSQLPGFTQLLEAAMRKKDDSV